MRCPTCDIRCGQVCPSCYESVFSSWHETEDAKRFAKTLTKPIIEKSKIIRPSLRIIREGTIGDCPECKSTTIKRFIFFGRSIGCINKDCVNYHLKYNK